MELNSGSDLIDLKVAGMREKHPKEDVLPLFANTSEGW